MDFSVACTLVGIFVDAVNVYCLLLLVYAVVSWLPDLRGRWVYYLGLIIEPVLRPLRKVIPPVAGLDLAFLVLLLLLQLGARPLLQHLAFSICYVNQ